MSLKYTTALIAMLCLILFSSSDNSLLAADMPATIPTEQRTTAPDNSSARQGKDRLQFDALKTQLGLTEDQNAQLEANRARHAQDRSGLREQIKDKREELRKALEATALDMNRVHQIHNDLKQLMMTREDRHLDAILEIRQILTPAQFAQFHSIMKSWHRRDRSPRSAQTAQDISSNPVIESK